MPVSLTPTPPTPSLSSLMRSVRVGNPAMELRLFRSMVMWKTVTPVRVLWAFFCNVPT